MPKGRKRAIKAATADQVEDPTAPGGAEDDEFMMELAAARAAMEEQTARRKALRGEGGGEEEAEEASGDGGGGGGPGVAPAHAAAAGSYNKAGLLQKAAEMARAIPWEETLTISDIPLELEDVHDDLKREVSFYNNALEAVKRGRTKLVAANVPYKRPEDFLCEMVKTDAHMDKIKDKLIFEQQKMDAFEQRKARQEQRKYAKELNSNKVAEKSKRKKEGLEEIEQWKKGAKRNRGGPLADDDGLDAVLAGKKARGRAGGQGGRNMKREAKDKKYGFGGKKREKGQSDPRSLNDLSAYNPKHGGSGRSRSKPAKGANRPGKLSAGIASVLIIPMVLAGLVAIFSAVKGQTSSRTNPSNPLQMTATPSGAAASESRDRSVVAGEETEGNEPGESWEREGTTANGAPPGKGTATTKPNVFFILIDDMGWNDIGYQSLDLQGTTPNLDKLAAGGVKMTDYYTHSVCTPARASLMTGRYVVRFGMQYNIVETGATWGLPLTEKIFPQYMKDAGYETHMVGKWHLGSYDQPYIPSERGFDTHLGFLEGMEMYWTHQVLDAEKDGRKFFDFGFGNATGYYDIIDRPVPDQLRNGSISDGDDDGSDIMLSPTSSSESMSGSGTNFSGKYSTRVFQDRAIEILQEKTPFDEEPLFMYLAHQAVHKPLGLPPEGVFSEEELALLKDIEAGSDDSGHLRKRFAKVLMYLDHTIGELVEYLETEGWMENSIIVLASDNGGCLNNGGSNYPLRGSKVSNWEGGSKVPAFVYSTSHIPEDRWGTEYGGLMHVTDWLPTLATASGITLDGGAGPLDGVDHWEFIVSAETGEKNDSPRQEMLYNFDPYVLGLDDDGCIGEPDFDLAQGAFRSGKWKYIANEWCTGWYTFSLQAQAADPLTTDDTLCGGSACTKCNYCSGNSYSSYLFDLDADPREENDLIDVYPEIAQQMRDRWMETALSEFGNSGYQSVDYRSYDVWLNYNCADIHGSTPLMISCRFSNDQEKCLALAQHLVGSGADPVLQDCDGKIALHHAAGRGFTDVVNMLLSVAHDMLNHIDTDGNTALMHAAANGQGLTLSSLLAAGANDEAAWKKNGKSALLTALSVGRVGMVKLLLDKGFDAVGGELAIPEAMRYAVQFEQIAILQTLLDVQGEASRAIWANRPVWTGPRVVDLSPTQPRGLELFILAASFGVPMVHCAAEFCSLRSVHVLLASGGDETAPDVKGACAKDLVGVKLPHDERDPRTLAAVRRMLARGPAFRARSWAWPSAAASRGKKVLWLGVRVYRRTNTNRRGFSEGYALKQDAAFLGYAGLAKMSA
eukprot:g13331.t2